MKLFFAFLFLASAVALSAGQTPAEKIYQTEKAFEKAVAEKGFNAGFIEYLSPYGVMFFPEAVNAHEALKARPASPAALTWNPILIDVAESGALAYSIGNSVIKPKGKDDPETGYGHYLSIWSRQPDGNYLAVLDVGVNHPKPASIPTEWRSPAAGEPNKDKISAADSAVGFYEAVEAFGVKKAYGTYLMQDAVVMRNGIEPAFGKRAAMDVIESEKLRVRFTKRKTFTEADNLAYVFNIYTLVDRSGVEQERGNFVQVWKLVKGKWMIAVDLHSPISRRQAS
ncbi:MAG: nuclear transport factor 2 family protein [Pyrinomonadaceae bacterium]|nr:nuclear transport factor 2 family protein [Pyrinomonadaceae bacterium]